MTVTEDGNTVIVTGSQSGLFVVDAKTGKLIFNSKFAAPNTANVPTPAYENGLLFWSVGYGKGSICFNVKHSGGKWTFEEAWRSKEMGCHPGNYVVADGRAYGKGRGGVVCLDLKTGEKKWSERVGGGQVCWADGRLYAFSDRGGKMALLDPEAAEGSKIKGQLTVEGSGSSWSHPVVIDGKMLLRYDTHLYCFDVKAR
jgi:outer membrane protein assembly factor BamB